MVSLPVSLVDFREDLRSQIVELEDWLTRPEPSQLDLPPDQELARQVDELKARIKSWEGKIPAHTEPGSLLIRRLLSLSTTELSRLLELRSQVSKLSPSTSLELLNEVGQLKLVEFKLESKIYEHQTGRLGASKAAPASTPTETTRWLQIGQLMADRYRVEAIIGRGGTGAVYRVTDTRTPQEWAIKELWSDIADAERLGLQNQLAAEISMLSKLRHPNLPRIVDAFENGNRHYIVMDYIRGRDLKAVLREVGPLPLALVVDLGTQMANVLDYLHSQPQPIIFRDLKPANIMVDVDGKVKLVDFGIARLFLPEASGDTQAFGTPGYAAPEQYGRGQSDKRTDVYTLGATLHELLTGRDPGETPFQFPLVSSLRPETPRALEALIAKCVAMNPDDRYPSLKEVLPELKKALHAEPAPIVEAPPTARIADAPIVVIMEPAAPKTGRLTQLLNTVRTKLLGPGAGNTPS